MEPVLNIPAFYLAGPRAEELYGYSWVDPRTNANPFQDKSQLRYYRSGETFIMSDIIPNGTCQPISEV
jgi:hypothetical protein